MKLLPQYLGNYFLVSAHKITKLQTLISTKLAKSYPLVVEILFFYTSIYMPNYHWLINWITKKGKSNNIGIYQFQNVKTALFWLEILREDSCTIFNWYIPLNRSKPNSKLDTKEIYRKKGIIRWNIQIIFAIILFFYIISYLIITNIFLINEQSVLFLEFLFLVFVDKKKK